MAVPARSRFSLVDSIEDPEFAAFQQFFGALAANAAVAKIAFGAMSGGTHLWVRLDRPEEAYERAVHEAYYAYLGTPGVQTPIDLHVLLPDEDDRWFPDGPAVFYRRP